MAKEEKKTITVNGVEHDIADLDEKQLAMVSHITDLDRKLSNARFNLDQLSVGRDAFINMLAESLKAESEEAA